MWIWWIHFPLILLCSVEDWRCKKISVWKIMIYGGVILLTEVGKAALGKQGFDNMWIKCVCGALPGLFFLLLSKVTQEQMGYGDGWLILTAGASLGLEKIMEVLLVAFSGIFFRAVYLFFKGKRKADIAFVPFLCAGMAVIMLWEWTGRY